MATEPGSDANLGERVDELLYRWEELRRRPVVVLTAATVVVAGLGILWLLSSLSPSTSDRSLDDRIPLVTLAPTSAPTSEAASLLVHVAGAVRAPGVYELPAGSRIFDALQIAGGATAEGQPDRLNLAAPVIDGMQVRVPVEGEVVLAPASGDAPTASGPIDLNTATMTQLELLPGIGPATATSIVAYREEVGRFNSVSDLLGVRGIGEAKLDAIRDLVTV